MAEEPVFRRLVALLSQPAGAAVPDWPLDAWGEVLAMAGTHLVTPALAGVLEQGGHPAKLPDEVREVLGATRDLNARRNARLRGALQDVAVALNAAGITPTLLKGAIAIAAPDYPFAAHRVVGDLDLLITRDELAAARAAILPLGYREATEEWRGMLPADVARLHHAVPLLHRSLPVSVELHWRILDDAADDAALARGISRHVVEMPGGGRAMIPDRGTRLLHNLLHAMVSDRGRRRREVELRQLVEFAALASLAPQPVDASTLLERLRLQRRGLLGLQWSLAARWLGLPMAAGLPRASRAELALFEAAAKHPAWRTALDRYDDALRLPGRLLNGLRRLAGAGGR